MQFLACSATIESRSAASTGPQVRFGIPTLGTMQHRGLFPSIRSCSNHILSLCYSPKHRQRLRFLLGLSQQGFLQRSSAAKALGQYSLHRRKQPPTSRSSAHLSLKAGCVQLLEGKMGCVGGAGAVAKRQKPSSVRQQQGPGVRPRPICSQI